MENSNSYIKNQFGIGFILTIIPKTANTSLPLSFYVCQESKDDGQLRFQNTLKYLYIWIAKKNVTFHSLYDRDLKGFLFCLNNEFKLPFETTLRTNIVKFDDYIEKNFFDKISNVPVSILIVGVTRNKNKYHGIILFISDQLYFLGLEPCEQATGENISKIIAKTADKIHACGSKLISVCTDNAANNIAALNYKVFSAQHLSGQNFFRFPCLCHTTNLAAKDVFQGKYIEIFTATLNLIKYFNELSKFKLITEKVPQFKEVRWFSLSKCVLFILTHYNYLNQEARTIFDFINNKYDWKYISLNLSVIKLLILKFEKDCASITDIYLNLKFAFHQLFQISALYSKCLETNASFDLYTSLFNRFTTTVQMNLPSLAFF